MIVIRKIDKYRDGGTIGIEAYVSRNDIEKYGLIESQPMITIDYAIGTKTEGHWYNGFRNKGAKPISDEELKNKVINEIEKMIEREQFIINEIKNGKTKLKL